MLKLLHTADWQIGKQFGQFNPDDAALLAEARFGSVERLATLARDESVDMVLVAGDVFDFQAVSDRNIHRLFHAMSGYSGPWVLIPGNHDAALAESVWTRAARLNAIPPNVHACLRPEVLHFDALNLTIFPAPLVQRHTHHDLSDWFDQASPALPADRYRIGLAHGSVQGLLAEGIDSANPIAAGRAQRAQLDYLALGDWHGTRRVDERTWYSGTHETDRFRDNDSGQALIVTLAAPGAVPEVTAVATGQYRWREETRPLNVDSDLDELIAWLNARASFDVLRLNLSGHTDLAGQRRLDDTLSQTEGRVRCLSVDRSALQLQPTDDDLDALEADGYVGDLIAELRAEALMPGATALAKDALVLLASMLEKRSPRKTGDSA